MADKKLSGQYTFALAAPPRMLFNPWPLTRVCLASQFLIGLTGHMKQTANRAAGLVPGMNCLWSRKKLNLTVLVLEVVSGLIGESYVPILSRSDDKLLHTLFV